MKLHRRYTRPGAQPLAEIEYEKRRSVITNPDGSVVFEAKEAEIPKSWSQLATDIVVSKYFRRAGVPTAEGRETSVRQVVHRIANTIRQAGEDYGGYFDSPEDAEVFEAELAHVLVSQMGAFNSPVWFNCGLFKQYGIKGSAGNWAWNPERGTVDEIAHSYMRPQCSACFIQSVGDDLMSIFELAKTEARIFKYGSGTGTNFSKLRSSREKLSGGGTSSGLMSFLKVLDAGAGATKSGGTTRRAAKMVCLDMDHPEIVDFINWKVREENKARLLIEHGDLEADFNGEAYGTVSGQNSNNSVRVTDEFMQAAIEGKDWGTYPRTGTDEERARPLNVYDAADLQRQICEAAWRCADPGVQFDTTINDWHTCSDTERIYASNPCSEYMFLDDSACNLASINLLKFLDEDGAFDVEGYRHAIRILFLAQEILVDLSSYPTENIARNSHDYRPLGLGYANLGALLMVLGIPYDSPEGTAMCGALTAILTGHAYRVSAEIAADKGPFAAYEKNRKSFARVMKKHRDAVENINAEFCPSYLLGAARQDWDDVLELGQKRGFRNAQATVLAPTGTIGLLMDCDTTGIEPDFALVKFKKLAGGGYFKIVNQAVPRALRKLGYDTQEIQDILTYINGTMTFRGAPHVNNVTLKEKGLTDDDLSKLESSLRGAMDLDNVLGPLGLSEDMLDRLGIAPSHAAEPGFNVMRALGFTDAQIEEAGDHICGRLTIEGAPRLHEEHLAVFDCANRCGKRGRRFIAPMGHVRMMAAAQPFISGAISKTVNLPREATVDDIRDIYVQSWKLGLKAIALYRDGCKMSQPLNSTGDKKKERGKPTKNTRAEGEPAKRKTAGEVFEEAYTEAADAAPATVAIRPPAPLRRKLPQRRRGITVESRIGTHKVYLRTGEYEDGALGEIFIDMAKEGAAFRSMMNCFAIAISKGLQYGVPLREFVDTFTFTRFEPQGMVDHPNIKLATSVIDFVFRILALEYLGDDTYCQVKPDSLKSVTDSAGEAANLSNGAAVVELRPGTAAEGIGRESAAHHESGAGVIGDNGNAEPVADAPTGKANEKATAGGSSAAQSSGAAAMPGNRRSPAGQPIPATVEAHTPTAGDAQLKASALDSHHGTLMGDAPFCDVCGHITVRNGTCYRCLNCGNSMGCS